MKTSSTHLPVPAQSQVHDSTPTPSSPEEAQLRVVRLIMVTDRNNNKFYEMVERQDGTFDVIYGRVGTAGSRKNYPIAQWDRKLREKIRKGYQNLTHLFSIPQVTWNWADISNSQVKSLMDRLLSYSKSSIQHNYLVNATEVSMQQVETAQSLLNRVITTWENKGTAQQLNELLLSLYAVIPRRMANVRTYLFEEGSETEQDLWKERLAEEQNTLDVMRGQVELNALSAQKSKSETRMLEALGLTISVVEDDKILSMIKKKMGPDSDHFVRAYEVNHQASHQAFQGHLSQQRSMKKELLWHGSRNENWFSILSSGLVLRPANAIINGKMFGYGIYFADKCRKSLNYSSLSGAYWTGGSNAEGFLALYEVHVGKQLKIRRHTSWCCELTKDKLHQKGSYDSVFAKGGVDLRNNEYVIYHSSQSTIRYLIEVKK